MEKKYFAESELIINKDGSVFHLHVRPEQLADKVILVGDPGRVALVASHFEEKEMEAANSVLSQERTRASASRLSQRASVATTLTSS